MHSPAPATKAGNPSTGISLRVRSADKHGRVLSFSVSTVEEAIRMAVSRGHVVIGVESGAAGFKAAKKTGRFPLLLFSQELLALLDAGLNLTEALTTLRTKEEQAVSLLVLSRVLEALHEGRNFSDVLGEFPEHFPMVYVATVKASERTGDLPRALGRLIAYQLQFDLIRKKLVSASIYPVMLLVVGGFVTLFLLGYVVPKFSVVYESSGRDIPWLSLMLLSVGRLIYSHWEIALGLLVSSMAMLGYWLARPLSRQMILDGLLKFPLLARKANEFRLSRFYRAVSLLLAAGIALPRATSLVSGLLSLSQQEGLTQARQSIEQGKSLSAALSANGLSTPVADSLIKVGERSGQMAEMLERAARFHDEDFSRWVDWVSKLLEPMLMTLIGIVIGLIVVLMYMPIFDLAGGLQ